MASLIMDVVVALLLIATIWFAIQLNGRLKVLRADGERLERLIAGLSAASHHAEEAVGDLRDTAGLAGRQLQTAIDKGGALITDLQFMIEKANAAADRLDEALRAQRSTLAAPSRPDSEARPAEVTPPTAAAKPRRGVAESDQAEKQAQNRLASLLKQAEASTRGSSRSKTPPAVAPPPPAPEPIPEAEPEAARPIALQSRAEREFLKALEERK